LRNDTESRKSFEFIVAFEDQVELLLGSSDTEVVESNCALSEESELNFSKAQSSREGQLTISFSESVFSLG